MPDEIMKRIDRLEAKIDNINDALISLARTEEKVAILLKDNKDLENRLRNLEQSSWAVKLLERGIWGLLVIFAAYLGQKFGMHK